MASTEYQRKYFKASNQLEKALQTGLLVRPENCELCGATPGPKPYKEAGVIKFRASIQAHHWRGYDHPTDVWWICQLCNLRLMGRENHAGNMTKEDAIKIVSTPRTQIPHLCKAPHDPTRD
jgi:hypothetical protein